MKETEFKALMYCGQYVDAHLLEKGLYICEKPFLYSKDETIENIAAKAIKVQDIMGVHHVSEKYFDNLKQCELVSVFLTERH